MRKTLTPLEKKKRACQKLWHWKLECGELPEAWWFSPPDHHDLDLDDPDDVGYAMLSIDLKEDKLVLMGGGRGGVKNLWALYAEDGAVVSWGDHIVVEKVHPDIFEICRWALGYYLEKVDEAEVTHRQTLVAQMKAATLENCVTVAKSLEGVGMMLESLVEQRAAALEALAQLGGKRGPVGEYIIYTPAPCRKGKTLYEVLK